MVQSRELFFLAPGSCKTVVKVKCCVNMNGNVTTWMNDYESFLLKKK